jgi:hypothetical protein
MNTSITELTCSILKRFRVLEPGRVVVSVAHRRPTPPLMLVVEKPVLHLNHWTLGHVVDNKNFPNSTNTNTQNGEPKKSLFPPFGLLLSESRRENKAQERPKIQRWLTDVRTVALLGLMSTHSLVVADSVFKHTQEDSAEVLVTHGCNSVCLVWNPRKKSTRQQQSTVGEKNVEIDRPAHGTCSS